MTQENTQTESFPEFRIYAASLSDYNGGILHGRWIDIDGKDEDEILEEIAQMLAASPYAKKYGEVAEEWAIHDYDNIPSTFGEHAGIQQIIDFVEMCEEHGTELFKAVSEYFGAEYAVEAMERLVGSADTFREYAEELADEMLACENNESLASRYFDYESFARDLEFDYDIVEAGGIVYIFHH